MSRRALPRSDFSRLEALEAAARCLDSLRSEERHPLSPRTVERLRKILPAFRRELGGCREVSGRRSDTTAELRGEIDGLRLHVIHFFRALHMAIARGEPGFRESDRAWYGLAVGSRRLPAVQRVGDLMRVAEQLVAGEEQRVAAGGKRIAMPTAREIGRRVRRVERLRRLRAGLDAAHDEESRDVADLRGAAEELVRDIWDELAFAHRKEPAPARRRRLREWGVVYEVASGAAAPQLSGCRTCEFA